MSNDLQAQISTNAGGTISQLKHIDSAVLQIHSSTEKLASSHRKFQSAAGEAFKSVHAGAGSSLELMKEMGHSLSLAGGEFGHLGHLAARFSTISLSGGAAVAAVGAAAVVATTAIDNWNYRMEASVVEMKEMIKIEDKLTEAIRKQGEARDRAALSALGSDAVTLTAVTGDDHADEKAQEFAKTNHEDLDEVRRAMILSYRLKGGANARNHAMQAALLVNQSGMGSLSQAMGTIVDDTALSYSSENADPTELAAKARGIMITGKDNWVGRASNPSAWSVSGLNQAISAQSSIGFLAARGQVADQHNPVILMHEHDAVTGKAATAARLERAQAENPMMEVLLEIARSNREAEGSLKAQAAKELQNASGNPLSSLMYLMERAMGHMGLSEGTRFQQLDKLRAQHAAQPYPTGTTSHDKQ